MASLLRCARPRVLTSACFISFLTLSQPVRGQQPAAGARPAGTAQAIASPESVALSPDGTTVAWTLLQNGKSTLHLTSMADRDPAREKIITVNEATNCSNSSPVWAPDGQTLAFTSSCTGNQDKPGQEQIFLWSKASGNVKQLTHVTGLFKQAAWSPDGATIAFLFVENATRLAGALDAMKPWAGVIGEDNLEIQGVYGVKVATGEGRWIVPARPSMYTFEFAWSPDSSQLAFIGAQAPGENNWWVAQLYVTAAGSSMAESEKYSKEDCKKLSLHAGVTCRTGGGASIPVPILNPVAVAGSLHGLQIAVPRWSPDGGKIAFIGGLMSDQGSTGGDVWVVDAKGGEPVDVTPGIDGTPCFEAWLDDETIGFVEDRRGHTLLADYNVARRTLVVGSAVDLGEVSVSGGPIKDAISFTRSGIFAFVKSSSNASPEVFAGPIDALKPLTHLNAGAGSGPKVESIEWENEGFHVQGWLSYPIAYDAAKQYPLIVEVHGGPSASAGPEGGTSMWSSLGYFTLRPNPRGSFGQGEAFVQANRKDFGYGDLRDILKGMDIIEAKVSIDKNREGLMGWSYGGFMAMFAVTQTHRFRAAIAGAGISDWESYYGENSIDQWMVPFFGATVYDDPAVYARSSAITYIKNVTTPTLVIVGDRDGECPAPQSFEFWHALRAEGVKTQLVIYPDEGHRFRNPEHIRDRNEREVRWFAENMPPR